MSEPAFTPGPLAASRGVGDCWHVYRGDGTPAAKTVPITITATCTEEADAKLYAAAPELYEMAELFARSIEYQIRVDTGKGDEEGARLKTATLNRVLAALAKAEGRS